MAEAIYKPIAVSDVEQAKEAVSSPEGVNRNLVFVALVVAVIFLVCSLFYVWAHHQVISLGYEISKASQDEQLLLQENKKLRLELAALKSPSRIESLALKKLGFRNPEKEQLIIVR
ncbi:MAG: cell division protein FtsL [Deltaproteobacteria bacterium RBG_19FT_COMBO_52_11]|nr:MAG: cell division protein FtsL [Deltaproteobacteria bacterium RBG_19FT_COMBO_52_11]